MSSTSTFCGDCDPPVEDTPPTAPPAAAPAVEETAQPKKAVQLQLKHACQHCRQSKTACSEVRPCIRCTRLCLDCVPFTEKLRKRACVSCHRSKISCKGHDDTLSGKCARCEATGIECIPRDLPTTSGKRKRRSPPQDAAEDLLSLAQGAPAVTPQAAAWEMMLHGNNKVAALGLLPISAAAQAGQPLPGALRPLDPSVDVAAYIRQLNWGMPLPFLPIAERREPLSPRTMQVLQPSA